MKVQLKDLFMMVCAYMGEQAPTPGQRGYALTLRDVFDARVVDVTTEVMRELPIEWIDNARPIGDIMELWREGGTGCIALPSDYLRLVSFRMSDWNRRVTRAVVEGSVEYSLQHMGQSGLAGTPERPVCVETGVGLTKALEYYSTRKREHRVAEALYVARPHIDRDGAIEMATSALPEVVRRMRTHLDFFTKVKN